MIYNLSAPRFAPETDPGAGGGSGGAPPAEPVPPPPADEPEDRPITLTSAQLRDRLDRSRTSFLRAHGFGSEDELKSLKQREAERQKAEDEARRAAMSREQQLQEDLTRERARAQQAEEETQRVRFERHVAGICAMLGVRHLDYALFEVERAAAALPEGQELDVEAWLKERMESQPAMRAALGLEAPVQTVPAPVTTVPGGAAPVAPRPGSGQPQPDVFGMDASAWQARRDALGIG